MGLLCGRAVLPFPSFDGVFLFHLLSRVALALVTFFALSLLSLLFLFLCFFFPFRLDLIGLGVCAFSEASYLCCALTSSPLFLWIACFHRVPVCLQVLSFFILLGGFSVDFRDFFLESSFPLFFGGGGGGGLAWAVCLWSCVGFSGLFSWLWEALCFCLCSGR